MSTGCACTKMNRSLHETYGEEPDTTSKVLAGTADVITSPIQAVIWIYEGAKKPFTNEEKAEQNQRLDPIVKTPGDSVEAHGTQGHP